MTSAGGVGNKQQRANSYAPKMWDEFFAQKLDVAVDDTHTFRVYLSAPSKEDGPLLVLLHGGGYSALTWSHLVVSIDLEEWSRPSSTE